MILNGKVAVVTGGAQGIGEAIVQRLYADGASVAILDINEDAANQAAQRLSGQPGKARGYAIDVANRTSVQQAFDAVYRDFDKIDILVNNAGITRDSMFHKMDDDAWDRVIDVNLTGVANCCKAVITAMRAQNYGKIVNLASVSAFGNMGQTNYGASKAGVIGLTKSLAKEAARNNITVNAVAPSYVDTDMLRAVPEKVMERFLAAIPLGRLARPDEIASVVAFLSCDDSSFVTGECITVSGGSHT